MQDLLLFDLLCDAVPEKRRASYRELLQSLPEGERLPCPACFASQDKNIPLRELGPENGFLSWRCTGCFTVYYRPPRT